MSLPASVHRIFAGQLISQICDKLMSVGLIWVISHEFSDRWVPWYIAVGTLPHLLLTPWSGGWIARIGALRVILTTDFFRAAIFIGAGLAARDLSGDALLPFLLALSFVSSVAGALFNPAILTLPIQLVDGERLQRTNALIDSCFSIANVLGPLCAILLYQAIGLPGLLVVNGASYFVSGALAVGIVTRPLQGAHSPGALRRISSPLIRQLLVYFLFLNLLFAPLLMFMPWYVKHRYGGDLSQLATLETAMGLGMVAGGLFLSSIRLRWLDSMRSVTWLLTALSAFYLIFSLSRGVVLGAAALAPLGFVLALLNIRLLNFFQTKPDQSEVPTVMSRANLISVASLPVSMGVLGLFVERLPIPEFAIACAIAGIGLSLATARLPYED